MEMSTISLLIVTCFVNSFGSAQDVNVVSTTYGQVRGHTLLSSQGREFTAFQGIPYAQPPIGDLRFRDPQPPASWTEILNATEDPSPCMQLDMFRKYELFGDEDCLYLNVYTPELGEGKPPLPVMVYIHGGGFMSGSSRSEWFGPKYLMNRDVVLVTINYRLGAFGFLSTADVVCPGNMGLKDQNAALQWVQQNINAFNGDPGKVTIFGQSAGGASVHLHMLSPLSKGLFHRAISQSGDALGCWVMQTNETRNRAARLGILTSCPITSSQQLLDCLQNKSAVEIAETHLAMMKLVPHPIVIFGPVVEKSAGGFLVEDPYEALTKGNIEPVPWITGITSDDGAINILAYALSPEKMEQLNSNYQKIFPLMFQYSHEAVDWDHISNQIRKFYFGKKDIDEKTLASLIHAQSDRYSTTSVYRSIKLHAAANKAPVYFYTFSYRGKHSASEFLTGSDRDFGVIHMDDLLYLFDSSVVAPELADEDDKHISDLLIDLWVNFAETGNPTPNADHLIQWPPVTSSGDVTHLDIDRETRVSVDFPHKRIQFWESLFPVPKSPKDDKSSEHSKKSNKKQQKNKKKDEL